MRVLVAATQFPLPARDGASLRILNLVRGLARRHQVVFCALTPPPPAEAVAALQPLCAELHIVPRTRGGARRLAEMAASPLRRRPYLATAHDSAEFRRLVERVGRTVDAAQGEFPYGGGQYLTGLPCPKILDAHNVEADILRLEAAHQGGPLRRLHSRLQSAKMQRFEREICVQMDAVLATSAQDQAVLGGFNARTHVIPNGIDLPAPSAPVPVPGTVTFTGLMSYPANIDAMLHFGRAVWPRLRGPGRRLVIVGRNPPPEVIRLSADDIVVTGEVPEVAPYLGATDVFVAPLRIGSGTRIKILEAMAHGLPVVSTAVGSLGLDVTPGQDILLAEEPDAFAEAVDALLSDGDARRRIGAAGRELVRGRYTWPAIGDTLNEVYAQWQ